MQQTIGERWHEEAEEHLLRDGVAMAVVIFLAWIVFTAFGYTCMASADSGANERSTGSVVMEASDTPMLEPPKQNVSKELKEQIDMEVQREWDLEAQPVDNDYVEENWYSDYGVADGGIYDGDWASNLKFSGGGEYGGHSFGWYSQNVMPGGGLYELNNNGRHVDDRDFVCDGDGYIAVAMDGVERGTVVETPWGDAKVYDSVSDSDEYTGFVDVYVNY